MRGRQAEGNPGGAWGIKAAEKSGWHVRGGKETRVFTCEWDFLEGSARGKKLLLPTRLGKKISRKVDFSRRILQTDGASRKGRERRGLR